MCSSDLNPLHNLFPIFFVATFYGLVRFARQQSLLVLAILLGILPALLWVTQGMRFAFPVYPLLLGFAVAGMVDAWEQFPRVRTLPVILSFLLLTVGMHAGAMCLYTYGACNAWFDRTIGIVPKNLGLSPEGVYTWERATEYLNKHAEQGAFVHVGRPENAIAWRQGVFRADLTLTAERTHCPAYAISRDPLQEGDEVLFTTEDLPRTYVVRREC